VRKERFFFVRIDDCLGGLGKKGGSRGGEGEVSQAELQNLSYSGIRMKAFYSDEEPYGIVINGVERAYLVCGESASITFNFGPWPSLRVTSWRFSIAKAADDALSYLTYATPV
jgi:hypothetical protein